MRSSVIKWFVSLPAAMFYCLTASGLHDGLASPGGGATITAILSAYCLHCSVALWVLGDLRKRNRTSPYDFDTFIALVWPIWVPFYLVRTRGWRAIFPIGGFVFISLAAYVCVLLKWVLCRP